MSVADMSLAIILLLNVFIPAMVWSRVVRTAAFDTSDILVVNVLLLVEMFDVFVEMFDVFVEMFDVFVDIFDVFVVVLPKTSHESQMDRRPCQNSSPLKMQK